MKHVLYKCFDGGLRGCGGGVEDKF